MRICIVSLRGKFKEKFSEDFPETSDKKDSVFALAYFIGRKNNLELGKLV